MIFFTIPVGGVTLTDDRRRKVARIYREAIAHGYESFDQSAQEAERDRRQFARQIDGLEGSQGSFMRQTDRFWQWLGLLLVTEFGLPREARLAAKLRPIRAQRKQMARAAYDAPNTDRRVG